MSPTGPASTVNLNVLQSRLDQMHSQEESRHEFQNQDQDHVDFQGLEANLAAVKQSDPSLLSAAEEEEQALFLQSVRQIEEHARPSKPTLTPHSAQRKSTRANSAKSTRKSGNTCESIRRKNSGSEQKAWSRRPTIWRRHRMLPSDLPVTLNCMAKACTTIQGLVRGWRSRVRVWAGMTPLERPVQTTTPWPSRHM